MLNGRSTKTWAGGLGLEVCDSASQSHVAWLGLQQAPCAVTPFPNCCRFSRTWCKAQDEGGVQGVQEELAACGEEVWGFDHKTPLQL